MHSSIMWSYLVFLSPSKLFQCLLGFFFLPQCEQCPRAQSWTLFLLIPYSLPRPSHHTHGFQFHCHHTMRTPRTPSPVLLSPLSSRPICPTSYWTSSLEYSRYFRLSFPKTESSFQARSIPVFPTSLISSQYRHASLEAKSYP